jgi:hypothetical protein
MINSFNCNHGEDVSSVIHAIKDLTTEQAYELVGKMANVRKNFDLNRGRHAFCAGQLKIYDLFFLAELLKAVNACDNCIGEAEEAAFEAQDEYFMDMENFETLKHCHRGLELYEACYKLMARYIQESGHERQGYFDRIDALVSESDNVTKEINFRLNELKQQKREAQVNSKRKVEVVH